MSEEVKTKPKSKKGTPAHSHKKSTSSKKSASGTPKKPVATAAVEAQPAEEPAMKEQPAADDVLRASQPSAVVLELPPARYPLPPDKKELPQPSQVTASALAQLAQRQLGEQPPGKHEPLSPPEYTKPQPSICPYHNQPFKYFCEACEEPICPDCQLLGPHNTELHRVSGLHDAFVPRFNYVTSQLYTELLRKRDMLLAQIGRVDFRIGEVRNVRKVVDRGIKAEYVEMLERLKSAEGGKVAVLQHDIAELQKDVERIDLVLKVVDDYTQGDARGDFVGFLGKFKEIHDYMEYAVTKPFKTVVEVVPHDLPRELTERRNLLQRANQSEGLLKLKDDMMWNLIQENKRLGSLNEDELLRQPAKSLSAKYSYELLTYELVCSYCGAALDEFSANTVCDHNTEDFKAQAPDRFTVDIPPADIKGTARHFFGVPTKKEQIFAQKAASDPKAMVAFTAVKAGGRRVFTEVWRKIQAADPAGKLVLPQASLVSILRAHYDVPPEAIERLVFLLVPPTSVSQSAYYKDMVRYFDSILANVPPAPGMPAGQQTAAAGTSLLPGRREDARESALKAQMDPQRSSTMFAQTAPYPAPMLQSTIAPAAATGSMLYGNTSSATASGIVPPLRNVPHFEDIVDRKPKLSERGTSARC